MKRRKIDYPRLRRMLWPIYKRSWPLILLLVVFVLVLAALSIAEPFIYGSIVDSVIGSINAKESIQIGFGKIDSYLVAWLVIILSVTLISAFYHYCVWILCNRAIIVFLRDLFRRILGLDVKKFEEQRSGEIIQKIDRAWGGLWNFTEAVNFNFMSASATLVFAIGAGLIIDWRLALVSIIPVPIIALLGLWNLRAMETHQHNVNQGWEKVGGIFGDSIDNIATVKNHVAEENRVKSYWRLYTKALKNQLKINRSWAIVDASDGGIYVVGRLLIFVAGVYFVLQGTATIGTLVMFLGFLGFIFGSIQQMAFGLPRFAESLGRLDRAAELWFEIPAVKDQPKAKKLKRVKGEVEFRNMSYAYQKGHRVLSGISFTVPAGDTYALVGESGAGKSTLAKMMLRFYDPTQGKIMIDGIDLREMTVESLRRNVGLVMQENLLFHESIIDNIRIAKLNASKEEIIAAAKRAQAHDFITKLPKGYNSTVGERGVKLSGGERQRIALARVLLEDPPILVLDEATSALDSKTEHALQLALKEVMKNRTTIVIAHRLSTVMAADQILVMDKGKIVDRGTHEELVKHGGLYNEYWRIQAGGYV